MPEKAVPTGNTENPAPTGPATPMGINHLVLGVRDIEESHDFWTGIMGFRQVGEWQSTPEMTMTMRFYSGADPTGDLHHHHVGLRQDERLSDPGQPVVGLGHVAIGYPSREAWLQQVQFLADRGVDFRRVDHGMTHSVYLQDPNGHGIEVLYDLPREVWAADINEALNYYEPRPSDELVDRIDHR